MARLGMREAGRDERPARKEMGASIMCVFAKKRERKSDWGSNI